MKECIEDEVLFWNNSHAYVMYEDSIYDYYYKCIYFKWKPNKDVIFDYTVTS